MNDEKIRHALHAAADECFSGVSEMPSQRQAVMERLSRKSYVIRRRRTAVPAIALLLMLAIAGAAAAGLGLFGQLRSGLEDEMSYNRLGLLEEAAVTIGQTTAIGGYGELTIDQAYCDGQRLYYSYTICKADAQTSLYLGDGAALPDDTDLPPVDSWIEAADEFVTAAFYEVALPEGFAAGENVAIVLTAIAHKEDGTLDLIDVPVKIPVTAPRQMLRGEGTASGYAAEAELRVTDVDVYGTVRIFAPEAYMLRGCALEVGGETYGNLAWGSEYDGEAHEIALRFDLPESLDDVQLVLEDDEGAHGTIELR